MKAAVGITRNADSPMASTKSEYAMDASVDITKDADSLMASAQETASFDEEEIKRGMEAAATDTKCILVDIEMPNQKEEITKNMVDDTVQQIVDKVVDEGHSKCIQLISDCNDNAVFVDELTVSTETATETESEHIFEDMIDELNESVSKYHDAPIPIPNRNRNGNGSMSEEDALRTIIKYTESSVPDPITPRISKLESIVQKVVGTNAFLMENLNEIMDRYNVETAPSLTANSAATTTDCHYIHSPDPDRMRKRKRSQSEQSECNQRERRNKSKNKNKNKYKLDRGPKLNTKERAIKRRAFNMNNERRIEGAMKEELRRIKQLQEMEREIKSERARMSMYKARPIKRYKPTQIVLPRRRLKPNKVGIYDRAIRSKRDREQYLDEFRRLRDLKLGILPKSQCDAFFSEYNLKTMTLKY